MSDRAVSLSLNEITNRAEKSAASILGMSAIESAKGDVHVGFFPDIGTMGLILENPDFEKLSANELMKMSTSMIEQMDLPGNVRASVHMHPGGITMGYFPQDPVFLKQLR